MRLPSRGGARSEGKGRGKFKLIASTLQRKLLEGEGGGAGREQARKSIIYVLTEADQKVAGAADIRQIMMAVEQARNAGTVGGGEGDRL